MIMKGLKTADDLLAMPRDGNRYELVRGELRMMSPAGYEHGRITVAITTTIATFVDENQLGHVLAAETGFQLASQPDTVRAPDVSFVSKDRLPPLEQRNKFPLLAPDLAVEVVSPNDKGSELEEKIQDYLAAGVRLIWIVYPATQSVTVYRSPTEVETLTSGQLLEGHDVLPSFRCLVSDLFPPA